jgi:hypothetical protein
MLLMSGWRYHRKPTTMTTVAVGGLAGLSGGAAQMSGPPATLSSRPPSSLVSRLWTAPFGESPDSISSEHALAPLGLCHRFLNKVHQTKRYQRCRDDDIAQVIEVLDIAGRTLRDDDAGDDRGDAA